MRHALSVPVNTAPPASGVKPLQLGFGVPWLPGVIVRFTYGPSVPIVSGVYRCTSESSEPVYKTRTHSLCIEPGLPPLTL